MLTPWRDHVGGLPPEQWTPGYADFRSACSGDIADSGVDPPTIVIAFDISEQVAPCGITIGVVALVDELGFQCAEKALHRGIVPAIRLAAHRLGDGGRPQDLAVIASGVLAAAIGVMNETRPWTAPLDCHGQGGDGEFGAHMLAHRPADDFSGEQIEDHGQVEPALAGRDVGDVRQPDLIRLLGAKFRSSRFAAIGRACLLSVVQTR